MHCWNFNEEILVPQGTPLKHSFAKSLSSFFWQILAYESELQIESASLQIDVDIADDFSGHALELVSKELNHFGVIADLFRQIGGHSK